jgi:hypothetical protein
MRVHPPNSCPAQGRQCYNCGRLNHLRVACRSPPQNQPTFNPNFPPPQ